MKYGKGRVSLKYNSRLYELMKKRFSEKMKGHIGWMKGKHLSEEAKNKISIAHKGKGHPAWNKGKHHSEETKEKLRIANKLQFCDPEKRDKHRQACKDKWNDEEYRRKVTAACVERMKDPEERKKCGHKPSTKFFDAMKKRRGVPSAMKGKHHSEESKNKNRLAHKGKTPWNKGLKRCSNGVSIRYEKELPEGYFWLPPKRRNKK